MIAARERVSPTRRFRTGGSDDGPAILWVEAVAGKLRQVLTDGAFDCLSETMQGHPRRPDWSLQLEAPIPAGSRPRGELLLRVF